MISGPPMNLVLFFLIHQNPKYFSIITICIKCSPLCNSPRLCNIVNFIIRYLHCFNIKQDVLSQTGFYFAFCSSWFIKIWPNCITWYIYETLDHLPVQSQKVSLKWIDGIHRVLILYCVYCVFYSGNFLLV